MTEKKFEFKAGICTMDPVTKLVKADRRQGKVTFLHVFRSVNIERNGREVYEMAG